MFGEIWPLISVVLGIIILLTLIIGLKLNTFISLIITSMITALLLGMPLNKLWKPLKWYGQYVRSYCFNLWLRCDIR